jgi:hypothetical protein
LLSNENTFTCIKLTPLIAVIVLVEVITRYALLGWDADVHHKEKALPKQTEPEPFRNPPTKSISSKTYRQDRG